MPNYLTKQGLIDLQAELKEINEVKIPEVLESINRALAEGDIKENSGLDAAKIEREKLISRQEELESILGDYEIIDETAAQNSKIVRIGSSLKIQYIESGAIFELQIVGSSEADGINGKISNESPLAEAVLGKRPGTEASFRIKNSQVKIKILEIL